MTDVTAVIINYNGIDTVLDTIESVYGMDGVHPRVLVIDDGSTDGSPEAIEQTFPDVDVYREGQNTREVNRLRNKGLALAETDRVFLTDNDVVFDASCISRMLRVMDEDDRVGVCIPRLMYLTDRSRIYHQGGRVHYAGATVAPDRDKKRSAGSVDTNPAIAVGGGIALFDRKKLHHIGGFDENYELAWGDDGELHQRFLLAGYKCLRVPSAVGFHEYKPLDSTRHYRARGQLHNRWRYILTHYSVRTLLLISPALVIYEITQASFYALKGLPLIYLKGSWDAMRHLPAILQKRKDIQALRSRPDKDLLHAGPLYLRSSGGVSDTLVSMAVTVMSWLFRTYWYLVRPLLSGSSSSAADTGKGTQSDPNADQSHTVEAGV